jgi:hypothetical protein
MQMKRTGISMVALLIACLLGTSPLVAGPYPADTGIHRDGSLFAGWATGYQNYQVGTHVAPQWQDPTMALGKAEGDTYSIVCLGRGGRITLTFDPPIRNGAGDDFAVFENGLIESTSGLPFLELAYVEVSSDGVSFVRFDNDSRTPSPLGGYSAMDPSDIDGLASKYGAGYGTPFDLEHLAAKTEVSSGTVDLNTIGYVRLIDIVGDGSCVDTSGDVIYDPHPTVNSAGFDLDAVGVINAASGAPSPSPAPSPTPSPAPSPTPEPQPSTPSLSDGDTVSSDSSNHGSVSNITVEAGVTVDNTGGTITGATNAGIITGGTLAGEITNQGSITGDLTLSPGTTIDGGTLAGTLTAEGQGATITNALVDATSISGVAIGAGCRVTGATVDSNPGLDLTAAIAGASGVLDHDAPLLVDEGGTEWSLGTLLTEAVDSTLQDASTEIQTNGGNTVLISTRSLPAGLISARTHSVTTTSEPDSASYTAGGDLVIASNGIAATLAPASGDLPAFENGLEQLVSSYEIEENGVVLVELPDGSRLAFRFDYLVMGTGGSPADLAASSASFRTTGDPEDPESFAIVVTYPDGTWQRLPPWVHDLEQFEDYMEEHDVTYRILPATGVIAFLDAAGRPTWRGIPDYVLFEPPVVARGILFDCTGDMNGDGSSDCYLTTAGGRQIIHAVPLRE